MIYEISYESSAMNNFLVVKPGGTNIIDYCATMMENNQIDGLLLLHRQNIEGEVLLYYNISGKKKLSDLLQRQSLNHEQCIKIILNIFHVFQNLERYFLNVGLCDLSLNNIYIDNNLNLYFILIPVENGIVDENSVLCDFFKELIGQNMLRYSESNMQKYANYFFSPTFSIVEFMELFKDEIENEREKNVQKKPQVKVNVHIPESVAIPVAETSSVKPVEAVIKEKPEEHKPSQQANKFSFAIPGGGPAIPSTAKNVKKKDKPITAKKENNKEVKEKKSLFGKLLNPKKTENNKNIQSVSIPSSSQQVQASPVQHPKPIIAAKEIYEASQADSWKGTDIYGNDGATAFYDDCSQCNSIFLVHNGRTINVNKNIFTIGRKDADYVISSTVVSGLHATVKKEGSNFYLVDENSKNGTIVNGSRIAPYSKVELKNGDIIQIGKDDLMVKTGM